MIGGAGMFLIWWWVDDPKGESIGHVNKKIVCF